MSAPPTTLLTKDQLAMHLDVCTRQVERLMQEGLPFIPVGRRAKRFRLESVNHWLLSREQCLSEKTKKAVGTSTSALIGDEFTELCQKAREKRTPSSLKAASGRHLRVAK